MSVRQNFDRLPQREMAWRHLPYVFAHDVRLDLSSTIQDSRENAHIPTVPSVDMVVVAVFPGRSAFEHVRNRTATKGERFRFPSNRR